jgi:SHS2 domain-containing protein
VATVGHYTIVEDVALADCALDIEGADAGDLFETAARALAELMIDPDTLPRTVERTIALEASEVDVLLFDWLSELIFRKDRDREAFPDTRVSVEGTGPVRLVARARGGVIDPARTGLRADPKAVTFHQFGVTSAGGAWRARVVIDL